jgi:hypothetical protein
MAKVAQSAHSPLAPARLWALMRDLERRPQWDRSVCELTREARLVPNGATILQYTAPLALGLTWRWEGGYVTFDPPARSSVRMLRGSALRPFRQLAGSWTLRPDGQGTLLRISVQFEPRLRLLEALVARRVSKITSDSLVRLGRLAADMSA